MMRRLKAFVLRFVGRAEQGWVFLSDRRAREQRRVGDGSGSSIVQAAVGWIARNFPEAPPRVQRTNDEGELETAADEPPVRAFLELLRHPNDWYSGVLLWMATIADFWIRGNAYWLKVRDRSTGGRVVALWWVPSWSLKPAWPEDDSSVYISHYAYKPNATEEYQIAPKDVVHFRWGFDPDNIRVGRSPLWTVLTEVMTDEEAQSYTATVLRNLGVPGVIISPGEEVELEETDAEQIKERFRQQFTADNRGEPLVLGAMAKVDRLSFSPAELDLRTLRRIPEERISAVLGVPAIVAGLGAGLDRSTFANFGEAREAGWEENIIPTQRLLSADLESSLLAEFVADLEGYLCDFDTSEVRVLQEDENKRWERYGDAAAKGLIPLSDFRRGVSLPVDDELHDVYLRDARVVAVRVDAPEATGISPEPEESEETPPPGGEGVPPEGAPLEQTPPTPPASGNGTGPTSILELLGQPEA